MQDVLTLSSAALPDGHRVVGFHGTEALSSLYKLTIDVLVARDADLDMDKVVGERLTLTIDRADDRPPLRWHGVIASFELEHELDGAGVYTLVLVPALWQLTLAHHSRIFVEETTPKILAAVFKDGGLDTGDFELRLSGTYKPLEHVCQYEETDFAFASRWMEREGLYYFFEQGDDREKLIVTDNLAFHQELLPGALRYVPQALGAVGAFTRGEAVQYWKVTQSQSSAAVKLKDYDYHRPDLDVSGAASIAPRGKGEVRLYGENFTAPDEGKRLATARAQMMAASRRVFDAAGTTLYLRPGYLFALDEHPRPAFNARYLLTAVTHSANQAAHSLGLQDLLGYDSDQFYTCTFTAIPASVQFRADRVTPRPRVESTVSAVVDGPADSEYAQIDKHGRYKVKVKFDEGDLADGRASTFVRMLQPHGGSSEGFHFPLRKGAEVLLVFLGGDPDRPVIAGVAPNAQKPSVVTAENHTKNVIHTGGHNHLEMEDGGGRQHVKISTPTEDTHIHMGAPMGGHHLLMSTNGNSMLNTVGNSHVNTTGNHFRNTTGSVQEHTAGDLDLRVGGHTAMTFSKTRKDDTHQFYSAHAHEDFMEQIDGFYEQKIGGGFHQKVDGYVNRRYGAGAEKTVVGDLKHQITGNVNENIGGYLNQTVDQKKVLTKGLSTKVTLGATSETLIGAKDANLIGGQMTVTVGFKADLNLSIGKTMTLVKEDNTLIARSSNKAAFTNNELAVSTTAIGKSSTGVTLTEENLAVKKGESWIFSAALAVFK